MEKTYIAIDLKSFYASVECVERALNPLTTNLVVADESRTSKTICLAVSPSLKAYGLSGRSRLFEVEAKAKEVKQKTGEELEYIVAVPRMGLYIDYSANIYSIYLKYFSKEDISVYSIDEVFIDATDYLNMYHMSARELTEMVIKDVLDTTGITATAGIAPNLYLCKVAMDIVAKHIKADDRGVRIAELSVKQFRQMLWNHRPMTDFWRTGPGTVKRLERFGIMTMGDVARTSIDNEDWLYNQFGVDAEILIDHAWGLEPCTIKDIKAYSPRSNSLSSGQVLKEPYSYEKARIVVGEMAEELALDLVDRGLVTDNISMSISYDRVSVDDGTYDGQICTDHYGRRVPVGVNKAITLRTATSSSSVLRDEYVNLFDECMDKKLFVRKINMSANNAVNEEFTQYDFFSDPHIMEKEKKMQHAMIDIKKRFGKNAIVKGMSLLEGATALERNGQIGGHKA